MLKSIKGIYKNGVIKPLEEIDIKNSVEVIITFLDITDKNREVFLSSAGTWSDIDTDKLKSNIFENRIINSRKEVNL